jgi:predicted acylesterase/phospholipase RssA
MANQPTIKHLVLSGGGMWGLSCYGALRESEKAHFWNINTIESIHSTSVGAVLAVMLALRYDWETLDDFLIKRPWSQVFPFNLYSLVSAIDKRGIFDKTNIYTMFDPLFKGKDLSLEITLQELFEVNGMDLHFFSAELNGGENFAEVDFSHLTHPNWKVLDAVYCSCCLPILFSPFFEEGCERCYVDGGILNNYPLSHCLAKDGTKPESVFGIQKTYRKTDTTAVTTESSLFDYLLVTVTKIVNMVKNARPDATTECHELGIPADVTNLYDVYLACSSLEERAKLIEYGADCWNKREQGV